MCCLAESGEEGFGCDSTIRPAVQLAWEGGEPWTMDGTALLNPDLGRHPALTRPLAGWCRFKPTVTRRRHCRQYCSKLTAHELHFLVNRSGNGKTPRQPTGAGIDQIFGSQKFHDVLRGIKPQLERKRRR